MNTEAADILREEISKREKKIKKIERRVRWLEKLLAYLDTGIADKGIACFFCDGDEDHKRKCRVFKNDQSIKPTPKDFE